MQSHKKFTPQLQNKSQIINNKVMIRVDLRMSIAIMPHNNLHARQQGSFNENLSKQLQYKTSLHR